jgi:hypothetical protein
LYILKSLPALVVFFWVSFSSALSLFNLLLDIDIIIFYPAYISRQEYF